MAPGDFSYRSGMQAARLLLQGEDRPTAIFAANDDMAAAVIAVAHGLDVKVPAEVSVAGFDDTPIASIIWPELRTLHQPTGDMAAAAVAEIADLCRRRMNGDEQYHASSRPPCSLVERGRQAHRPFSIKVARAAAAS